MHNCFVPYLEETWFLSLNVLKPLEVRESWMFACFVQELAFTIKKICSVRGGEYVCLCPLFGLSFISLFVFHSSKP